MEIFKRYVQKVRGEKMNTTVKALKVSFLTSPIMFVLYFLFCLIMPFLTHYPVLIATKEITNLLLLSVENGVMEKGVMFFILLYAFGSFVVPAVHNGLLTYLYYNFAPKTESFVYRVFYKRMYKTNHEKLLDNTFLNKFDKFKGNLRMVHFLSSQFLSDVLVQPITLIFLSGMVFIYDPIALLIFVGSYVIVIVLNSIFTKRKHELDISLRELYRKNNYHEDLLSTRDYSKEIKLYQTQQKLIKKWYEQYFYVRSKNTKLDVKHSIVMDLISIASLLIRNVYVLYLVYQVAIGNMDVGTLALIFTALQLITGRLWWFVSYLSGSRLEVKLNAKLVLDFLGEFESELRHKNEFKYNEFTLSNGEFKSLKLKNVSYKYPVGEFNAVNKVNFEIRKGEIISILGYNGCGKTTLSKLMIGLLNQNEGEITLNGVSSSEISKDNYFKYFGVGFQEYTKHSMTLKDNIKIGMIEKYNDESEYNKALEKGNLQSIIDKLPNKDETLLGKEFHISGMDLSIGEWQRVAITRSYMGEPEVLILDEPTASVDPFEELRILERFKDIINGKTAILISHRIGFAKLADKIAYMKDGKIIEFDTHDNLIKIENGHYKHLFNSQKELYTRGDDNE